MLRMLSTIKSLNYYYHPSKQLVPQRQILAERFNKSKILLCEELKTSRDEKIRQLIQTIFKIDNTIQFMHIDLVNSKYVERSYEQLEKFGYKVDLFPTECFGVLQRDFRLGRQHYKTRTYFGCTETDERDTPLVRKTLYFDELKDVDKWVDVQTKIGGEPELGKTLRREQMQQDLLDKKNPLGQPKTEPMVIRLNIHKPRNKTNVDVEYYFNLRQARLLNISGVYEEEQRQLLDISKKLNEVTHYHRPVKFLSTQIQQEFNDFVGKMVLPLECFEWIYDLSRFLYWRKMINLHIETRDFLEKQITAKLEGKGRKIVKR